MDKDRLEELIAALQAEREATIQEANQRIAYLNGKIAMLEELAREATAETEE